MTEKVSFCQGCGIALQTIDPAKEGFSPKVNAILCKRCYRLTHYGELQLSANHRIKTEALLKKLASLDALFLWVIDLFHLEESMIDGLIRHLPQKDIIIVATKRELLPATLSQHKITSMIQQRCKSSNIIPKGIVVVSDFGKDGTTDVFKAIDIFRNNRDVVVFGVANAGKSTLINALFPHRLPLTVSQFPGTTIDLIPIVERGYTIYDTPGIEMRNHFLDLLSANQVKILQPKTAIKPIVYQLSSKQTLIIGQIAMIHIDIKDEVSAVLYLPEGVDVHRTKTENAQAYWDKHTDGKVPYLSQKFELIEHTWKKSDEKTDVVLMYIGFISILGDCTIKTQAIEPCGIFVRKAVI
jgi:30S ribosome assembly GTPase